MAAIPSGTVTFLFTDIEGSTRLWERFPEEMKPAFARHEAIIRSAMRNHGGFVFKMVGDSFQVAFETAEPALHAALEAQRRLLAETWDDTPIRVRIALHSGVTEERGDDYFGPTLNRVARLLSTGYGGQVLLTQAAAGLVADHLPEGVGLRDLGEQRLKDLTRVERIYQLTAPGLPEVFPQLKTAGMHPNNLPIPRTSFVGRETETGQITELLTSGNSTLLTLIGAGGTGKTRLALQSAERLRGYFTDGIWLVELAVLNDPQRVPLAIAEALGVRETAGISLTRLLVDHIHGKRMLLILDNCEHLIEACGRIAEDLLRECPALCILATSRELLGTSGEVILRISPLSIPEKDLAVSPEALLQYESVRLFVDRAGAVSPGFRLTAANAAAVAQICQRLDGIPLALELAAARLRLMDAAQIAAHIDDAFRLLGGGRRTALPRQQTLRALIDWSYDLLSAEEQHLLASLSVFSGGWTLRAAEAVGEVDNIYDALGRLVDKSLVIVEPSDDGAPARYRMLEIIRQYASEKLRAMDGHDNARDRHLRFFRELADHARPYLRREEGAGWMDLFDLEMENLRQALDWSLNGGADLADVERVEEGMRLSSALMWFWHIRNHWRESAELLLKLLEKPSSDRLTRASGLRTAGFLLVYNQTADFDAGVRMMEESIAIFRDFDAAGRHEMAKSLVLLGGQVSDRQRGLELVTEGLEIFRAEQNSFYTAEGLLYLGLIMDEMGDEARSDAYFEESLALRRQIRDSDGMGFCLYFLGNKDFMRGNYPQARSRLEESAACFQKAGNQVLLSKVFNLLSTFWLAQGDYSIAAQYSEDAVEAVRNMTDSAELVSAFNSLAVLAWARGDFANAEQASQEAERAARKINCAYPGDISQWVLGRISLSRGDTAQAEAHLLPLLKAPNLHPMALETARLFDALAGLAVLSGNLQRAAVLLGAAEAATRCWWMVFSPRERSEHQAWQDAVSGRETEDALAQGRAMTFQEMLTFAAAELIN